MAKKLNGTWKAIATVGTFIIVIVGAAIAYGALSNQVETMKPDVKQNTEHRIKFEERVTTMQADITTILQKVSQKE